MKYLPNCRKASIHPELHVALPEGENEQIIEQDV